MISLAAWQRLISSRWLIWTGVALGLGLALARLPLLMAIALVLAVAAGLLILVNPLVGLLLTLLVARFTSIASLVKL